MYYLIIVAGVCLVAGYALKRAVSSVVWDEITGGFF